MSKKLWQEVEGERQFLIPEGTPLEAGSLEIENGAGDKMMVSEDFITPYLASEEDVEEYQDQAVEETIAELGKAFSSLFQAGKELFSQAMQDAASPKNEESSEEESSEEESENVVNVDFEEKSEEEEEGFFAGLSGIFQESKVEFQSIFQEAKQEFKKSLRDQETAELLKSIGNQIVDFANNLQQEDSEENTQEEESENIESPDDTPPTPDELNTPEPPPVSPTETPLQETDEDSDDAPPSPLSDSK